MKKNDILKDLSNEIFEPIDNQIEVENNNTLEENLVNNDTQEFNFTELLENVTEKIDDDDIKEDVSLNDINTIISDHFSDVEEENNEVSFSEMVEEIEENDNISLSEDLLLEEEDEDEDITFNDLNNRTQEFNFEDLNIELEKEEQEEEKEEKIVSNFPKLDKFGSVFPRKNI